MVKGKIILKVISCLLIFCSFTWNISIAQKIEVVAQGKPSSIRGLSVVDDHIAWISGSNGHIAMSKDGGQTWLWQQVKGFEKSDFRDIEAFTDKEAIIMSSGTPAMILKTIDGGATWKPVYRNDNQAYFLDAMDFADKNHGLVMGDPINGKFLLLETTDAGNSWHEVRGPDAITGEAAFAASGTCLRIINKNIYLVTGGTVARVIYSALNRIKWQYANTSVIHGKDSQGIFSLSIGKTKAIIIGGDYVKHTSTDSVSNYFNLSSVSNFSFPQTNPSGYQSCVEFINDQIFLSTGTPGSNLTVDGGQTWKQIDSTSFNVCRKAKKGNLVLLAGDKGKIAIFKFTR